jgi:hypothetical protein
MISIMPIILKNLKLFFNDVTVQGLLSIGFGLGSILVSKLNGTYDGRKPFDPCLAGFASR